MLGWHISHQLSPSCILCVGAVLPYSSSLLHALRRQSVAGYSTQVHAHIEGLLLSPTHLFCQLCRLDATSVTQSLLCCCCCSGRWVHALAAVGAEFGASIIDGCTTLAAVEGGHSLLWAQQSSTWCENSRDTRRRGQGDGSAVWYRWWCHGAASNRSGASLQGGGGSLCDSSARNRGCVGGAAIVCRATLWCDNKQTHAPWE